MILRIDYLLLNYNIIYKCYSETYSKFLFWNQSDAHRYLCRTTLLHKLIQTLTFSSSLQKINKRYKRFYQIFLQIIKDQVAFLYWCWPKNKIITFYHLVQWENVRKSWKYLKFKYLKPQVFIPCSIEYLLGNIIYNFVGQHHVSCVEVEKLKKF